MSNERSEGTLFRLPREVRDQIYSQYFSKAYIILWTYHEQHPTYQYRYCACDEYTIVDNAILRTSKAISSDAKHFLFCRAASQATTFKYNIEFDATAFSTPPVKEVTDRMLNVEFHIRLNHSAMVNRVGVEGEDYPGGDLYRDGIMDPICEATVDRFAGTAIIRNKLKIRLVVSGADPQEHLVDFMRTRFFQAFKTLQGFQELTMIMSLTSWCRTDESRKTHRGAEEISAELEPHLGQCVIRDHLSDCQWAEVFRANLKFQPQISYTEGLRARPQDG